MWRTTAPFRLGFDYSLRSPDRADRGSFAIPAIGVHPGEADACALEAEWAKTPVSPKEVIKSGTTIGCSISSGSARSAWSLTKADSFEKSEQWSTLVQNQCKIRSKLVQISAK